MLQLPAIIALTLVLFAASHALASLAVLRWKRLHALTPVDPHAKSAVLLAIRGCDPYLPKTIKTLLVQDYPSFEIHLVIDNKSDTAWKVVHEVIEEFDHSRICHVHEMVPPPDSCSLKCHALSQLVESLNQDIQFITIIDSDIVPHQTWLSELVNPLNDPKTGVVSGNHWFSPNDENVGSLLRSIWNSGALVPTSVFANPWAGSCAIRHQDVRDSGLVKIWRKSIVDDGPIRKAIEPLGKQIQFAPNLIMINREKCTLKYLVSYIARMLTWSRIYEKTFWVTAVHMFTNVGLLLAGWFFCIWTIVIGDGPGALWLASGLMIHSALLVVSYLVVRSGVGKMAAKRGETLAPMSLSRLLKVYFLMPVVLLVYGLSMLKAINAKKVKWREITYDIADTSNIRMLGYQPLVTGNDCTPSEFSI